jgi:type VI secretion system secreted protein VgrG
VKVPPPGPWAFSGTPHGEFVVGTKDPCVFVTVLSQTGEATAVAEGSITVRSADGFEKVYVIDDTTKTVAGSRGDSEVRQGDWVAVSSAAGAEPATAAYVYDLSRPGKNLWRGKGWWHSPQWQWRWNPGHSVKWRTPKPCPTPSATPTPTPTFTEPPLPSETPTPTEVPTDVPTETPTPEPTETPVPEPTVTITQTVTATPAP